MQQSQSEISAAVLAGLMVAQLEYRCAQDPKTMRVPDMIERVCRELKSQRRQLLRAAKRKANRVSQTKAISTGNSRTE